MTCEIILKTAKRECVLVKSSIILAFVILISSAANAEKINYNYSVTQSYSKDESPDDATIIAVAKARKGLIDKLGLFVVKLPVERGQSLVLKKLEGRAIASNLFDAIMTFEKQTGTENLPCISIVAKVSFEKLRGEIAVATFLTSSRRLLLKEYKIVQIYEENLLKEIEEIESQNSQTQYPSVKSQKNKKLLKEKNIHRLSECLAAVDLYRKAYRRWMETTDTTERNKDCSRMIQLDPNFSIAYYHRGLAYEDIRQHQKGIEDFNEAIRLAPNFDMLYIVRGDAYTSLKEYENAMADYNRAISLDPNVAIAYSGRGTVYERLGQMENACSDARKTCELDKDMCGWLKHLQATSKCQ